MKPINDEFRIYYNQIIYPELKEMDRLRRKLVALFIIATVTILILIGLIFQYRIFLWTLLAILPLLLLNSYLLWRIRKFKSAFKPKIVPLILDFIQRDVNYGKLNYQAKNFISLDHFISSELFHVQPFTYKGEDLITGNIGELPFQSCELEVAEESRVNPGAAMVFKGIFTIVVSPIHVKGKILIVPNDLKQFHARSIKAFFGEGNIEQFNLFNNQTFNNLFSVYATNNINLTAALPETLQNALVKYSKDSKNAIFISIVNDKINIAQQRDKNHLEPKFLSTNTSFKLVQSFYQDILSLTSIISIIDQNN